MRAGLILVVLFGGLLVFAGFGGIEGLRQTLIAVTAQPGDDGNGPVPSSAVRYRLDFTVRVAGQLLTGSKVFQIALSPGGGDGSTEVARVTERFQGEAITIPMPGRPTLIAILATPSHGVEGFRDLFRAACGFRFGANESALSYIARVTSFRGSCIVPPTSLPIILSIADQNDARTMALADYGNLSKNFGNDVEFVSANISTTEESTSAGIMGVLPWLKLQPGQDVDLHGTFILNKIDIGIYLSRSMFIAKA